MRSALSSVLRFGIAGMAGALLLLGCTALLDTSALNDGDDASASAGKTTTGGGEATNGGERATGGAGPASGGAPEAGANASAGKTGAAGAPSNCKPTSKEEACDGIDNDCDPATPDVCPAGCSGFVSEGAAHVACSNAVPFSSAQLTCLKQSMNVVAIGSASENADVLAKAKDLGAAVWLGAQDDQNGNHTLSWPGGSTISINGVAQKGVYTNFASGQPVVLSGANCVRMDTNDGTWSISSCTDPAPFVCEPLF